MALKPKPAKTRSIPRIAKAAPVVAPKDDFAQVESDRRVRDVSQARSMYNRFVNDDIERSSTVAQTRNQLEGGRPFDPKVLQDQGASWQTNVNFGDAQAQRDRTLLPYWEAINGAPNKASFTIDSPDFQAEKWQAALAWAFDEFHEDWGADYFVQYMSLASNFVNFGPGAAQFQDADSPRYAGVNVSRIYWPKNCKMSPDSWECLCLVRDVSASEMYLKIKDKKTAAKSEYAGWNLDAIKLLIVQMKDGGATPNPNDFTRLQDQLVNNDLATTTPFQPAELIWLYVRQFTGKIGCYVFSRQSGVDSFLYEDHKYAESFRHLLGMVWYDTGTDGMVHSIKGFGIKNYYFSALLNRSKSRFVDSGTMAMGMNFQYDNENTPTETPPVEQYGPFSIFPAGMKQLQFYPQIQGSATVIEMLANNQNENNSIYRQQEKQIENSDTATQANILANMAGQLSKASAAIFLSQYGENVFSEQFRRLRKRGNTDPDAKQFVKRLRLRGVPDKVIFDSEIRVKTAANAMLANPALRAQMFQQDLQLMNLPGVNQRWFLENLIANRYGAYAVDKALLPEGQESNPAQRRAAEIENTVFGQGTPLNALPADAHYEHLDEHLKPLEQILIGVKQSGQPPSPEAGTALALGVEHSGQHLTFLQKDQSMKKQFQEMKARFSLVASMAKGVLTQMQQASQQAQQQPMLQ